MSDAGLLRVTILVYAVIFAAASALCIVFRRANWGRNMAWAIGSWLVIFVLFIGTAFLGARVFAVLILAISVLALTEFYRIAGIATPLYWIPALAAVVASGFLAVTGRVHAFYAIPGLAPLAFVPLHWAFRSSPGLVKNVSVQLFGLVYWGWMPWHFVLLRRLPSGFGILVLLCSMIALNDNSAYYAGKLLGKGGRKMSPRISPNKTWIGFAGGTAAVVVGGLLFRYCVSAATWPQWAGLVLLTAAAVPLGDLSESAMKRDLGVKDTGTLIPGHGGVMDRFDSWVFVAPAAYVYAAIVAGGF